MNLYSNELHNATNGSNRKRYIFFTYLFTINNYTVFSTLFKLSKEVFIIIQETQTSSVTNSASSSLLDWPSICLKRSAISASVIFLREFTSFCAWMTWCCGVVRHTDTWSQCNARSHSAASSNTGQGCLKG